MNDKVKQAIAEGEAIYSALKKAEQKVKEEERLRRIRNEELAMEAARQWVNDTLPSIVKEQTANGKRYYDCGYNEWRGKGGRIYRI